MTCVCHHRTILHHCKMTVANNIPISGQRKENITDLCSLIHGHDTEAVKNCLYCLDRINLCNDYIGTKTLCTHSAAFSAPSIACDYNILSRDYQISSTHNAIPSRLTGTIAIVKEILAVCIIGGNHREFQLTGLCQCFQAKYTSSRFLGAADNIRQKLTTGSMKQIYQISSVINNHVRLRIKSAVQELLILCVSTVVPGKNIYPLFNESRCYIILSRKRVTSGNGYFCTSISHNDCQIRSFCLKVYGHYKFLTGKRLSYRILLINSIEKRHKVFYPVDFIMAGRCKLNVPNH